MEINRQYQSLIENLDRFIRKYYANEAIRGAIFSGIYVLGFFLAINLMEYYLYLSPALRKVLFFGFILSSLAFVGRFLLLPLLHQYRLGKVISHEQAANIIGNHFGEVKDKLLNVLQLKKLATLEDYSLVNASINQKITELKPITFANAIDLRQNRRYARFLVPPVLLFLFIIIAAPNIIKQGTQRLYHNDTTFEKEAPFHFVVKNKNLTALQFDNYDLEVTTTGDAQPSEMYLETDGGIFKLRQKEKNLFVHEFVNVQKTTPFHLSANGFKSKEFALTVTAKPVVSGFEIAAEYPAYIGKQNEKIKNVGDLTVPYGTRLVWHFDARNTENIVFKLGDSLYPTTRTGDGRFSFSKTALQGGSYGIKVSNAEVKDADSVFYSLTVVPDLYPVINVQENRDSANDHYFYYLGDISDDYGLRRLTFNYQIERADSGSGGNVSKSVDVPFTAGAASRFNYYWNMSELGIKPGDRMSYYFEVWDNDGIHGSKSMKSALMKFDMPTMKEIDKQLAEDNKEIKDDIKQTMKDAHDLKNKLQDMQDKMMDKKNLNWDDKKNMADMMQKQKDLQKELSEMKDKFSKNTEKQNEYKELDESIREKQKQLQELANNVMNDEMKKLMDKLEKMLDEMTKKDALDKMEDMKANNEKIEKELDRMLELFKKLEFDQKLQEQIAKLEKLAADQEKLAAETDKKNEKAGDKKDDQKGKDQKADNKDGKDSKDNKSGDSKKEDLKDKQEKLSQETKDAQKEMAELKKLNEETKNSEDMKGAEQDMSQAEQDQQDAEQNMSQSQNSKASKSQKSAANNMKEAAKKMAKMKQSMEQEEESEDMASLRQLLKNILSLSFDQERLMGQLKTININTPKYVDMMKEQQRIKENSVMVEDSLYALAKRVFRIESFVTKQMTDINKYLGKSIAEMEDRNTFKAAGDQQYVMTGYNNLALMLSETQQDMQQQESQSNPKDGTPRMCSKCKKPGNGLPNISKMQQQLKDKISQLAEQMKKGEGLKPGEKPGGQQGQNGMSKQFAEMAAQQAQMRRELERLNAEEKKAGKGGLKGLDQAIQQMEQNETDLVNKRITTEMQRRQQEILTRLLEAEKAEKERGEKPERESNTGKDQERKMPPSLEEYLKQKQVEVDWYKTVPPALKPYYKTLAEKYFKTISGSN
ncbi:MAG: DUF4175 domain-containing protein [Bacteroidetes bacterium]|nr:DUF4175 domain-containing protein [Bacteroidota bacterium]